MNAPFGGDSGGITATTECASVITASTTGTYACKTSLGLEPGSVGATTVAGNCGLATQQFTCNECEDSDCMQQLCAPLELGCRHNPSGAIINPNIRIVIATRWKEPLTMNPAYHGNAFFR